MKKSVAVLLLVAVLYLVSSETLLVVVAGPEDCMDACSTACVQYLRDSRRMARCERKCSIRCGPDAAAANKVGTIGR